MSDDAPTTGTGGREPADMKRRQLEQSRVHAADARLTTQHGVAIGGDEDSLRAGDRGPTLLQDFHAREKLTHFDHERIPERVVHARGAGAYGTFRPYDDRLAPYTAAGFLTDPGEVTPVFVRFSTVVGSRGSADTVRDVRGFATKFYTKQGNYDLVGNNIPVFFIQDGVKFPDLVHAVKPEPHNEIPQAASAHDTFWDFVALHPETTHMVMWLMSDRALPRSFRMMQGFGVHTFRLVSAAGRATFVKFHWTPMLGTHSLVWEECQRIAGVDPDFHRRDLWDAIEGGHFPEWELGVQLVDENDEFAYGIDLLDPTKILPEEQVPVRPVGRMVLNRNPDNFFAETEQVAFHTANLVPGLDFTNDPLLQARNFSYLDTQLIRLGGPNFAQLPVNRPVVTVTNNQRDGYHQSQVHVGQASYHKNTLGGGCPMAAGGHPDAFTHYQEKVDGHVIRRRSDSFSDHFSQARLFWRSMSDVEKNHIVAAFRFELGKVTHRTIREAVVDHLARVDGGLARHVADGIGVAVPEHDPVPVGSGRSPALSQVNTAMTGIRTRKVAVLVADGVDGIGVRRVRGELVERGAVPELVAPVAGRVRCANSDEDLAADRAMDTVSSVLYDAVIVPCGPEAMNTLSGDGRARDFVAESYRHAKAIGAFGAGLRLLDAAGITATAPDRPGEVSGEHGVITTRAAERSLPAEFVDLFAATLARHRVWGRATEPVGK